MSRVRTLLFVLSAVIIIVAASATVYFLHYINQPAVGQVVDTPSLVSAESKPATPPPISQDTPYASFSYSSDFTVAPANQPHAPQLATYSYVAPSHSDWAINIQIDSLPSGNINDDGSYHYRSATPQQYSQETKTYGGDPVYVMTDITSAVFNKTAFWVHNAKIASINLSGGTPSDTAALDTILDNLLKSWSWK